MKKVDCYQIGFIKRPHGLKGEVTVVLNVNSPDDMKSGNSLLIEKDGTLVPYFVHQLSLRGEKAFIKFDEVSTYEEAADLNGCALFLPKTTRPILEEGDFYDDEIMHFEVVDDVFGELGTVKDIERAGASRYFLVQFKSKEIMIPAQTPLLKKIDKVKKRIEVNLPDGFLDI